MKNCIWLAFCFLSAVLPLYAGGQKEQSLKSAPAQASPFFTEDGGRGISLAILAPRAVGLAENQGYIPALVQGEFVSNFSGYSALSVMDRENLDNVYAELLSGYYDDSDGAGLDLGHLTATDYLMTGSITKTATGYTLQIQIIKTADKMTAASYSGTCTFAELADFTGIRRASLGLLQKLGVKLTPRSKAELAGAATSNYINAQTSLAQGITAEKTGATLVEVMQYYYQAVDYDSEMVEAIDRLAGANNRLKRLSQPLAVVRTGNIREDAMAEIAAYRVEQENKRIDDENRQVWLQQLTDFENYFTHFFRTANAPLELIYSTNITQSGDIDKVNETISLQFEAALLPLEGTWFRAAEQTISAVRKGLIETGRAEDWGIAEWPQKAILSVSPFTNIRRNYTITAVLLDESENVIGNNNFSLSGGWDCTISSRKTVAFTPYHDNDIIPVVFAGVKISDITDTLSIRITAINGQDAEIASESGVLAIIPDNQKINQIIIRTRNELKKQESAENFAIWSKGDAINSRMFLGYVYTPGLPGGFLLGLTGKRFGGYLSFSVGTPEHSSLPKINDPSNPLESREDHFMDMLFGIYFRPINNFFIDVGVGFYGNSVYGLFNVQGHSEPVWCNIGGGDGVSMGLALQAGLLYSFKWFYLSTGYRQYFDEKYTPSFYIGGGLCIPSMFDDILGK
jgi:hypothetical protein